MENEKAALIVDEQTYARQLDLLRFQSREISTARLQPDEEGRLTEDFQRAGNASRLLELCQEALNLLGEQEDSPVAAGGRAGPDAPGLATARFVRRQLDTPP